MAEPTHFIIVGNIYSGFRKLEAALAEHLSFTDLPTLDPTKPYSPKFSKEHPGFKLILDPRLSTPKILDEWAKALPQDCVIIHLQHDYTHTLQTIVNEGDGPVDGPESEIIACVAQLIGREGAPSEQELERLLISLYKHDLWIRRLKQTHAEFVDLYCKHLPERMDGLWKALGIHLGPRNEQASIGASWKSEVPPFELIDVFSETLLHRIRLYEDRRLLLNCARFVSEACRRGIVLGEKGELAPTPPVSSVDIHKQRVVVLTDYALNVHSLRFLLPASLPGKCPSNVIVVFTDFHCVRELLSDPFCLEMLESYRLKLWHRDEWKERLLIEYQQARSSILHCSTVLAPEGSALKKEIEETLDQCYGTLVSLVTQEHQEAIAYYASDAFQERLRGIANGERPRILIEQSCRSLSSKQYSRCCAATFREMGYEVFIHEPCRNDRMDFAIASTIEIRRFHPDLVIRTPNIFGYVPFRNIPGIPILLPLQDLEPHLDFCQHVQKEPLGIHDMVYIVEERFVKPLSDAGVSPEQICFDQLPAEAPRFDLDSFEPKYMHDVGFVKTMSQYVGLLGMVYPGKQAGLIPLPERTAVARAERTIVEKLQQEGGIDFHSCRDLCAPYKWAEPLGAFCHEQLCLLMMNTLHQSGFDLGLSGSNWEKFPHLSRYSLGHVEERLEYQQRFLTNRINISLNPWDEYHPRIFDGGRCGAFFLVYQPPETVRWQSLPEGLKAGEHFDYFQSPQDLLEKCRYYLERPELCREIGRNLKRAIDEKYSYERVCRDIVERFRHLLQSRQAGKGRNMLCIDQSEPREG